MKSTAEEFFASVQGSPRCKSSALETTNGRVMYSAGASKNLARVIPLLGILACCLGCVSTTSTLQGEPTEPYIEATGTTNEVEAFVGIGVVLAQDGNYVSIDHVLADGPAETQGSVQSNDLILSIASGLNKPLRNVVGWKVDDVAKLLQGDEGEMVLLELIQPDARPTDRRLVEIKRDSFQLTKIERNMTFNQDTKEEQRTYIR